MPEPLPPPAFGSATEEETRRELATRVHAFVCGQGFRPEWIVAEAAGGEGWEVTLGVDGRRWRFGAPAGGPFRFAELTPAGEIPLRHPPVVDRDPASAWACATLLLAAALRDHWFRGFDCPVI